MFPYWYGRRRLPTTCRRMCCPRLRLLNRGWSSRRRVSPPQQQPQHHDHHSSIHDADDTSPTTILHISVATFPASPFVRTVPRISVRPHPGGAATTTTTQAAATAFAVVTVNYIKQHIYIYFYNHSNTYPNFLIKNHTTLAILQIKKQMFIHCVLRRRFVYVSLYIMFVVLVLSKIFPSSDWFWNISTTITHYVFTIIVIAVLSHRQVIRKYFSGNDRKSILLQYNIPGCHMADPWNYIHTRRSRTWNSWLSGYDESTSTTEPAPAPVAVVPPSRIRLRGLVRLRCYHPQHPPPPPRIRRRMLLLLLVAPP